MTTPTEEEAPAAFDWSLVVALGLTTIISYGTTYYLFGVLVVPIAADTGWNRATILAAYSASIVVAGLLGIPVGRAADRREAARGLLTVGSVVTGAALLLVAVARGPRTFCLLWAVGVGLGNALTFYPVTFTVLISRFASARGKALAVLTLMGGLASAVFMPLGGWLAGHAGWRGTLVAAALFNLLVAAPLHWFFGRHEFSGKNADAASRVARPAVGTAPRSFTLSQALRVGTFWRLTAAIGLATFASRILIAHQVAFLTERLGDGLLAASATGLLGIISLPGRYGLNVLSDRFSPRVLLGMTLALAACGVGMLPRVDSRLSLGVYLAIHGFAMGAITPLQAMVMADAFGRARYGAISAAQGLPVALFAGAGPLLAGWLYDWAGNYQSALWVSAGAFFLAAAGVLTSAQQKL